jgi:hypothetical protein
MADKDTQDTLEYREAMVEWAALTHGEVRSIRRMVQVFFVLWLLSLGAAAVAGVLAIVAD